MRQTVKSVVNIEEVINNLTSTTVIVRDNKSYKKIELGFTKPGIGLNIFDKDGSWFDCKLTLEEAIEVYNKL